MISQLEIIWDTFLQALRTSSRITRPQLVALVREQGIDDPRLDLTVAEALSGLVERGAVIRTKIGEQNHYHLSSDFFSKLGRMMKLTRSIHFEPGHDCRRFECRWGKPDCQPGSGGYHGICGLGLRFVVRGDKGAVQFLLYTDWLPEPVESAKCEPLPADLGYHALAPQWEGQTSRGPCEYLDGAECYYDGSTLNAEEPFRILCNEGDEALWVFLEQYYHATFEGGECPKGAAYPFPAR